MVALGGGGEGPEAAVILPVLLVAFTLRGFDERGRRGSQQSVASQEDIFRLAAMTATAPP
jgi:hypothetical protein